MQLETLEIPIKVNSSGFNPAIAGVVAGVAALVGAMVGAVAATADWAKDLDGLGDVVDGTTSEIAAMAYVARKSGTDVDKVAKANVLLSKSLLKSNGQLDTAGKKLKEYGIAVKDVNGKVKTGAQLTEEISKKYNSLATAQERVNFLTEIYGKSGADMIDFFDTLNGEGGISAVTKKVEALGLAIDPSRYEQFNRNLNELKLIGLGIAVGFTEKVMPALERLLGWFMDFIPRAKKAFSEGGLGGLFDLLIDELGKLDTKLAEAIGKVDWEKMGTKFGEAIDDALSTGLKASSMPKSVVALGEAIKTFLVAAVGQSNIDAFKYHFVDYIIVQLNILEQNGTAATRKLVANMVNALNQLEVQGTNSVRNTLNNIELSISDKLREIAKEFFNRALAWGQQMVNGLANGKGRLLSYIGGLVEDINGELKKIITSFTITVKTLFSGSTTTTTTGTTGGGFKPPKNKKAAGGPVVAGHIYNVSELGKPEYFIPATNGRINPNPSSQATIAHIDRRDMQMLTDMIVERALSRA